MDPPSSREEAKYERDEVEGPLRTSVTGDVGEEEVEAFHEEKMTRSERDVSCRTFSLRIHMLT